MKAATTSRLANLDDHPYTGYTSAGADGAGGTGVAVATQRAQPEGDLDICGSDYPGFEGSGPSSTFPGPRSRPHPPQKQPHAGGFSDGHGQEDPFQSEYVPPSPSLLSLHGRPSPNRPNEDITYDYYIEDAMGIGRASS